MLRDWNLEKKQPTYLRAIAVVVETKQNTYLFQTGPWIHSAYRDALQLTASLLPRFQKCRATLGSSKIPQKNSWTKAGAENFLGTPECNLVTFQESIFNEGFSWGDSFQAFHAFYKRDRNPSKVQTNCGFYLRQRPHALSFDKVLLCLLSLLWKKGKQNKIKQESSLWVAAMTLYTWIPPVFSLFNLWIRVHMSRCT